MLFHALKVKNLSNFNEHPASTHLSVTAGARMLEERRELRYQIPKTDKIQVPKAHMETKGKTKSRLQSSEKEG